MEHWTLASSLSCVQLTVTPCLSSSTFLLHNRLTVKQHREGVCTVTMILIPAERERKNGLTYTHTICAAGIEWTIIIIITRTR